MEGSETLTRMKWKWMTLTEIGRFAEEKESKDRARDRCKKYHDLAVLSLIQTVVDRSKYQKDTVREETAIIERKHQINEGAQWPWKIRICGGIQVLRRISVPGCISFGLSCVLFFNRNGRNEHEMIYFTTTDHPLKECFQ